METTVANTNLQQFHELAFQTLRVGDPEGVMTQLENRFHTGRAVSFAKAAVAAQNWGEAWAGGDGKSLAGTFLETLAPVSLVDAVAAAGAMKLPENCPRTQVLSGMSAEPRTEGAPAVATRLSLAAGDLVRKSPSAVVALTDELVRGGGDEAFQLLRRELVKQIARASNAAFLAALTTTSASAGTTTEESLLAGLDVLGDCAAIVVAASRKQCRELAIASEGRMGINGGAYVPGVQVVPADVTNLILIPADRVALELGTLQIVPATSAAVQLVDAPDSGEQELLSLWQNGLKGIRVQRDFAVYGAAVKVA